MSNKISRNYINLRAEVVPYCQYCGDTLEALIHSHLVDGKTILKLSVLPCHNNCGRPEENDS